ncbi:Peptidyl-prolyl cis-trans isomerase CWC27 like protein [Eufriesea mexicana]|uniref:Spliceosome-associated protein CWC27 homolog n=1 Tax=Eufriesea mexicana TaxID=516756 RepID=A0A310SJA7_9HYME|nr:Peptidyl-prolyl cis-trans isomerase CWC27 like protein [Eufriesea mexicana]
MGQRNSKTCRNFIQLSVDGYWDDTILHRIIKGFITQGGDPAGTGEGSKIYGEPFKATLSSKNKRTEILNNPFSDILPRIIVQESEEVKDRSKTKPAGVKDFNLLSFGEEAEDDDEESVLLNKKFSGDRKYFKNY